MLFRMIGAAVVYGFALFGVVKFFARPMREILFRSDAGRNDHRANA